MSTGSSSSVTNNFYAAPVRGSNDFGDLETSNDRKERQYAMTEDKSSSSSGGSGSGDFLSSILQAVIPAALAFFTGGGSVAASAVSGLISANSDKKA
jgi:hypothetical protein